MRNASICAPTISLVMGSSPITAPPAAPNAAPSLGASDEPKSPPAAACVHASQKHTAHHGIQLMLEVHAWGSISQGSMLMDHGLGLRA